MRGIALAAVALWAAPCCHARAGTQAPVSPAEQCRTAIETAEHAQGIPPHLLAAIGRVESGRWDPRAGHRVSWPWTIDVDGRGGFFPNEEAAIEAVRALRAKGVLSIDVGCVQISLLYHPDAFATLREAFDPMSNAGYGARFLRSLFYKAKDWNRAAGLYHSANQPRGDEYRRKVMAAWNRAPVDRTLDPVQALARAWAATLAASP